MTLRTTVTVDESFMLPIRLHHWISHHPISAFFGLTYLLSWGIWLPLVLGYKGNFSNGLFLAGIFGPALAAAILTKLSRRSIRRWLGHILRWRIRLGWYLMALGFPMLLISVVSLIFALFGYPANFALLRDRAPAYLSGLLFVAFLGGGQEELGWRGFALPHLQQRYSPVIATLILGVFWGLWHLPIVVANPEFQHGLKMTTLIPVILLSLWQVIGYAFCLTWLFNHTQSVLLTIILHASFNTANEFLVPLPLDQMEGKNYQILSIIMTITLTIIVVLLTICTRGKLGYKNSSDFYHQ